jgi:hypothetical protein
MIHLSTAGVWSKSRQLSSKSDKVHLLHQSLVR